MTETTTTPTTFRAGSLLLFTLLALAGHALSLGAGFIVARMVEPSVGGGFEDLAGAVLAFGGVQLLLGLACLVGGIVFLVKRRIDKAAGLLLGWLLGGAALVLFVFN